MAKFVITRSIMTSWQLRIWPSALCIRLASVLDWTMTSLYIGHLCSYVEGALSLNVWDPNRVDLQQSEACHAAVGPPPQVVPLDYPRQSFLPWMVPPDQLWLPQMVVRPCRKWPPQYIQLLE